MSKEVIKVERYGTSLLENLAVTHEQVLDLITEEKLQELGEMAKEGCTLHEMAASLNISFGEFLLARANSPDFDQFCQVLETAAAGTHLKTARWGIQNPGDFSAAAYDRVMGALGFTPHVSHVKVQGATSDAAAERAGNLRVGFDVNEFMGKYEEKAPIDITPEAPHPDEEDFM